ncbi:PA1571 family protein [Kaarinaea lacus]
MKQTANPKKLSPQNFSQPNFHGASIVTESGKEIPITEQMLQKTFKALINAWEQSRQDQPT